MVIEARGVGSRFRDLGHPVDEIVEVSRPFETIRQNADSGCSELLGMSGLKIYQNKIKHYQSINRNV
jgi:hypothetical protein